MGEHSSGIDRLNLEVADELRLQFRAGYPGAWQTSSLPDPRMDAVPDHQQPVDPAQTATLLARAQSGDERALSDLFARYRDRILRIARVRIGDRLGRRLEADDIAQLTLKRAWEQLGTFDPRDAPRLIDWLAVIAEHCIRDEVKRWNAEKRRDDREVARESSSDDSSVLVPLPARDGTPSQHASARERAEIYDRCLSELPAHYREVILLRQYANLSWEAAAAALASPTAKAAVQMHLRAMAALRDKLVRAGFEPPAV